VATLGWKMNRGHLNRRLMAVVGAFFISVIVETEEWKEGSEIKRVN
jgi:hypothetical protein